MWPSNVKNKQTQNKTKTTTTRIYLIHTHTHARTHASSFKRTHIFLDNNLYSDIHSFIYMNIQYIYNTQLVQKDKSYLHTCTRYNNQFIAYGENILRFHKTA